ncbi:hypothetical protein E4U42_007516 [Claviceps africana]|uniref:Transcription factor domain-containing protein n=1 Tax=Claviceps africana TaxID=83212 RepID=A0A8K0J199_9HYPO|nr:hypothetical protein E4U42_007516 [Claviceps africana]
MGDPRNLLDAEDNRPAKRLKMPPVLSASRRHSAAANTPLHHQTLCQPLPLPLPLPQQIQMYAESSPCHPAREQNQSFSLQTPSQSPSMALAVADPADELTNNNIWPGCALGLDPGWAWPTSAQERHPSTTQLISPRQSVERSSLSTATLPPPPPPPPLHTISAVVDEIEDIPSSVHSVTTGISHDFSSPCQSDTAYLNHLDPVHEPAPTKNFFEGEPTSTIPTIAHGQQPNMRSTPFPNDQAIESPFRDCIGTFGLTRSQSFHRPVNGQVNGYIKFSWPKEHVKKKSLPARKSSIVQIPRITELDDASEPQDTATSSDCVVVRGPHGESTAVRDTVSDFSTGFSTYASQTAVESCGAFLATGSTLPHVLHGSVGEVASLGAPQLIPSEYGYEAKMDNTDRRFWMFYVRNWCPGRSVLEDTNLWLKDFAQMHKSLGVRSAIQSLAGIYIYDYQPLESIRDRVNQRFEDAEKRFTQLLNDPATYHDESQANELITIGVILSMQDIILTERRLKKPFIPRWLRGFRHAEHILQATDHGSRFWRTSNVQTSALRISQSVIVGRAVILAQPMSPLPRPDEFDAAKEASRFGWLLYGTEKDMYQVHGGCGFSKKLLHILSQVTYCAARLHQDAESPVVPVTADYIHQELLSMRQWSPESRDWEVVKDSAAVIEWVRLQPPGYKIDENSTMTDVTAEAWRIAAILYLLCRVYRLPRNHPDIVSNLDDLVQCITIMPTSGMQFTAQAPLFPVFFLGILAILPEHRATSHKWFEEVLQTPVRSSVPPLYAALKNIWTWIDIDCPPLLSPDAEAAQPIHLRHAWWERVVDKVQDQEKEYLCLT